MNTTTANLSAATVSVGEATDALGLAIEALEWLRALAHQIATTEASQHTNLATLAEFVSHHAIGDACDAIERMGGDVSIYGAAA
jgi:hypothetical protein